MSIIIRKKQGYVLLIRLTKFVIFLGKINVNLLNRDYGYFW